MFADKVIIQTLDKQGELHTSIIRDTGGDPLLIDFPEVGYERPLDEQAFTILSNRDRLEVSHYIRENLRNGSQYRAQPGGSTEFYQEWSNIPISEYGGVGMYCLLLPQNAAPQRFRLRTDFSSDTDSVATLVKDPAYRRFLLYLRLRPGYPRRDCSFQIDCSFVIDETRFRDSRFRASDVEFVCDSADVEEFTHFRGLIEAVKALSNPSSYDLLLKLAGADSQQPSDVPISPAFDRDSLPTDFRQLVGQIDTAALDPQVVTLAEELIATINSLPEYSEPGTISDGSQPDRTSKYTKAECLTRLSRVLAELAKGRSSIDHDFVRYSLSQIERELAGFEHVTSRTQVLNDLALTK